MKMIKSMERESMLGRNRFFKVSLSEIKKLQVLRGILMEFTLEGIKMVWEVAKELLNGTMEKYFKANGRMD